MNIVLIGYGKMGKTIEQAAISRGHSIVSTITSANSLADLTAALRGADVAIEFTNPESAMGNVMECIDKRVPVVSGTTGWNKNIREAGQFCLAKNSAFLHASNFSVGVNILFEINKRLAKLMDKHSEYDVAIEEIHHLQKKDAPSGTAITLAEGVIKSMKRKSGWALAGEAKDEQTLPITAIREEGVPGTHTVAYTAHADTIELTHTAHNRDGFAIGAVLAAEFLKGKHGVFTMKDVLGF